MQLLKLYVARKKYQQKINVQCCLALCKVTSNNFIMWKKYFNLGRKYNVTEKIYRKIEDIMY